MVVLFWIAAICLGPLAYLWIKGSVGIGLLCVVPFMIASIFVTEWWEPGIYRFAARLGEPGSFPVMVFVLAWIAGQGIVVALAPMGLRQYAKDIRAETRASRETRVRAMMIGQRPRP